MKEDKDDGLRQTVAELAQDMAMLRGVEPKAFAKSLSKVLARRSAPMLLLRADKLEALGRLPVYGEMEAELTNVGELDLRTTLCVFISHRWWRNGCNPFRCAPR